MALTRHRSNGCLNCFERLRLCDGGVGADGHGNFGSDELAQRVEPLARRAHRSGHALTPVVVVLWLVHRVDTGQVHPCDLLGRRESAMLDAVTSVGVGVSLLRSFDGIEHHVDGGR